MFFLKNREFAMTFDVSAAYCGMNGAMYFVEMDQDGGKGLGANGAGAAYGTGYSTPSAHTTSSSSRAKPTPLAGLGTQTTPIKAWGLASTALAVQRWTSGNPDDPDQSMG